MTKHPVSTPLDLPKPTIDPKHQNYEDMVANIAGLVVQQCNLMYRHVPDTIVPWHKQRQFLNDIVKKLEEV